MNNVLQREIENFHQTATFGEKSVPRLVLEVDSYPPGALSLYNVHDCFFALDANGNVVWHDPGESHPEWSIQMLLKDEYENIPMPSLEPDPNAKFLFLAPIIEMTTRAMYGQQIVSNFARIENKVFFEMLKEKRARLISWENLMQQRNHIFIINPCDHQLYSFDNKIIRSLFQPPGTLCIIKEHAGVFIEKTSYLVTSGDPMHGLTGYAEFNIILQECGFENFFIPTL